MDKIRVLLELEPSEVLVNFMTSHIKRFLELEDDVTKEQFIQLFGESNLRRNRCDRKRTVTHQKRGCICQHPVNELGLLLFGKILYCGPGFESPYLQVTSVEPLTRTRLPTLNTDPQQGLKRFHNV